MRQQIIIATLFDLMVGNNDAHAKNFSLIHHQNGAVEFAPRYDLVPTRLFRGLTNQLAYNLGEATTLEEVTASDFDLFLAALGIENRAAQRRIRNETTLSIGQHLADQISTLAESKQKGFADLIASNIRHLFEEFKLEIPELAQNRDASILVGGGWPMPS
jgi:serine/threonine-protein kinase HipA